MKKDIRFTFSDPIYEFKITVVITEDMCKWAKKYPDPQSTATDDQCRGLHCGDGKDCLIVIGPDSPLSDVAHEIGHAARYAMNNIGFKIFADNDEPLAYYEDFLTKKIHARIKSLAPKKSKRQKATKTS